MEGDSEVPAGAVPKSLDLVRGAQMQFQQDLAAISGQACPWGEAD